MGKCGLPGIVGLDGVIIGLLGFVLGVLDLDIDWSVDGVLEPCIVCKVPSSGPNNRRLINFTRFCKIMLKEIFLLLDIVIVNKFRGKKTSVLYITEFASIKRDY